MNATDRVKNILEASQAARDSDKELLIIYMQKSGMNLEPYQIEKFREMPSAETLTRIRRELQEKGLYRASEAVEEARYKKFKETRTNIKGESAEKVLEQKGYKVLPYGK